MNSVAVAVGIIIVVLAIFLGTGFFIWRRILRFAKSIERGLKMVPIMIDLPPPSDDTEIGTRDVRDVMQEKISQAETLYSLIASTAQKGFKSKFYGQRHIAFELVAIDGVIRFYAAVPVALVSVVKQAIHTAYPNARLEEVEDHNLFSQSGKITGTFGGEITLKDDSAYPIATFNELKRDAMQAIINAMSALEKGDGAGLQILLRPAHDGWTKHSEDLVEKKRSEKGKGGGFDWQSILRAPFQVPENEEPKPEEKQLTSKEQANLDKIEEKTKHPGYEILIRVIASSSTANRSQSIMHNLVSSFALFDAPGLNGFEFSEAKDIENFVTAFVFRFFPPAINDNILNTVELATLFHFPEAQFTHTSQLQRQQSKQVDAPSNIVNSGLLLGYNIFRNVKKQIRLSQKDRRRHVYIVGQTGTGKTTALENIAVQDMLQGNGFAFIDPHGDAAEKLLTMVPKERAEDVIYFNPGDMENPLGLNLFEADSPEQKDFVIQEAINMLYRLYDPGHTGIIGPRYEHMFRNAALTIMADPKGGTFVDIPKLFRDQQYVREKLQHVDDASVREFWLKEMAGSRRSSEFGEVVSWFISKFGAFMNNAMMRNILGQRKSAFDMRRIMDEKKILLVNLSKGKTGELNSMLLGMIFITKFQAAAMSRADVPEKQRPDFSLIVDEFQNFSTESFEHILSEARKYRLNLIVANQFISQLNEEIREAVFGNVGTVVSYRTGPNDADFLVKQFSPVFDERDLVNLPNFHAAVRLMVSGLPSQPFSMEALPPLGVSNPQLGQALKQLSAAKHGRPRSEVEADIFSRFESGSSQKQSARPSSFTRSSAQPRPSTQASAPSARSSSSKPGSSSSSFLDEWLAKRKQAPSSQPPSQASAKAEPPDSKRQDLPSSDDTGQPSSRDNTIKPSEDSSSQRSPGSKLDVDKVFDKYAPSKRKPEAKPDKQAQPDTEEQKEPGEPTTQPTADSHQERKISRPGAQADTGQPAQDEARTEEGPSKDTAGEEITLEEKLSQLQAKTSRAQALNQDDQTDKTKPKTDQTASEEEGGGKPELEPGEVYIDEEGNIYTGTNQEYK